MSSPTGTTRHILAINDDPAILQLYDDILTEEGYRVTLGTFDRETGDLLELVRDLKPDLVLMDFVIGRELKGWSLLQACKMDRSTNKVAIVICTGAVKQVAEMSANLFTHGIQVVIKPFDIDELLLGIKNAL